jgi:hypothetical protein
MKLKKSFILIFLTGGLLFFLSQCIDTGIRSHDPRGNVYAGSASCRQCHQAVYDSFVASSHFNSTRPSSAGNILGSFVHGQNAFAFNPEDKVVMEQRDSGLFQVLYVNGKEQKAYRFDITFGLKHAQTFLYWQGNKTFEMPVSFYTAVHSWASSPGYSSTEVNFQRFVGKNCFECHSSYVKDDVTMSSKGIEETLDKNTLVMGIDCERCHGPAINHVNYHRAYPEVKEAKYIISSRTLSRQQKLDACAVCHAGNDKMKQVSAFRFKMGDTLANYFSPFGMHRERDKDFDVHGNQYGLLAESQCFLKSQTLECTTCHDPHTNASNDLSEYSKRCVSCHYSTDHRSLQLDAAIANTLQNNCIDCHMPKQPSRAISFQLAGSNVTSAYLLRTHKIAIYPGENGVGLPGDLKKRKTAKPRQRSEGLPKQNNRTVGK